MVKRTHVGLGAIAVSAVAIVAALIGFTGAALAAGTVSLNSPSVGANGAATVTLTAAAPTGSGIGNWEFDITYNPGDYSGDPTCSPINANGDCAVKPFGVDGKVRFAGATGSAQGLTGNVEIGTITFTSNLAPGACSDLTITIIQFQDENGTDFASPTVTNGKVCAPVPTPTPTPVVTATTTPSPIEGDFNCDGIVDQADLLPTLQVQAGVAPQMSQSCVYIHVQTQQLSGRAYGDLNCDGFVTIADFLYELAYVAGLNPPTPAGCSPLGGPVMGPTPTPSPLRCGLVYPYPYPGSYHGFSAESAHASIEPDGSTLLECDGTLPQNLTPPATTLTITNSSNPDIHCTVDASGGPGGAGLFFGSFNPPGKTDEFTETVESDRSISLSCHYHP